MWDGHMETVKDAKHIIELTSPDASPIDSVHYRAGKAARTFEKTEIGRLLEMNVIEPVQMEGASTISFAPKTAPWYFESTIGH